MSTGSHKYLVTKVYRYGHRRYKKRWYRKKSKDKRGFMRYSSGTKWAGKYDRYKPAFWRTYQVDVSRDRKYDNDLEVLSNGYTVTDNWIALCKSWNGFIGAKREGDHKEMKIFAMQIRSIQKALGLPQSEFDMFTPEEMQWMERESDDTLNELRYAMSVPEL
jgi:hypothetical protein